MSQSKRIIIFANGELPDIEKAHVLLRTEDYIICADGGTHHALALGLRPDLIVGDMDSIDKDEFKKLQQADIEIDLHPRDKDETDMELALHRALEEKPDSILVIGALGGRLDQTFGNLSLLSDPSLAALDVRVDDGVEEILFCRKQVEVRGRSGDIVSLIPWNDLVKGVVTEGLKWVLHSEILYPERTRGISNEMTGDIASIIISSGLLLVIHRRQNN